LVRKQAAPKFEITHRFVRDPQALEEGLELWATFLAGHLIRRAAEKTKVDQEEPA
jgi:hypothetical protein